MISKEKYEKLKEEFGQKASWAVWAEGEGDTYIEFVRDLSVFEGPDLLDTLHNNFVVIGSHPSTDILEVSKDKGNWVNFHEGQNDYKLRYAFKDTPIFGSYMTDFYSNQSVKSDKDLDESDINRMEAREELKRELNILGGNPILISLGRTAESNLLKFLKEDYSIYYLTHHADYGNEDKLREKVLEILEEINVENTTDI